MTNQPPPRNSPPGAPPRPSPGKPSAKNPAVRSAMRADAPTGPDKPQKITKERLKEGAVETLINSFAILRELAEDFRSRDRFFQYKAGVLGGWAIMCLSSIMVSCWDTHPTNEIHAQLVVSGDTAAPLYMVRNGSAVPWQDVLIEVNGTYRATMARMEGLSGAVTLSSAVLFDAEGKRAPRTLQIDRIELHVAEPEADLILLKDGQPTEK